LKEEAASGRSSDSLRDAPHGGFHREFLQRRTVERAKQSCAGVRTGFIFDDAGALTRAILRGDTEWLIPVETLAHGELLDRMREAGKKVAVWTVNDADRMRRFLDDDRIDGIITDRTDAALAARPGR
jgi:glycerophosphoryl diester phosphodiesterase